MELLRDDQKADLNRLKRWLHQQRTRARIERGRQKAEEAKAELDVMQPSMFDF